MSAAISTGIGELSRTATGDALQLSAYCQEHLSVLGRSDQRRWGEVYVRGLVDVPGRKSIRRICEHVVGCRADQSLQQFVNQSTWPWEPVRRSLAEYVAAAIGQRAWVVHEAVFPKNGSSSVGVVKQYASPEGRILNCQLGLAVSIAGDQASCPVNWRLLLPKSWDDDELRRRHAHLPSSQRHRAQWRMQLEAVEEMLRWGITPVPVVVDATDSPDAVRLVDALEDRGVSYVVQVGAHVPAARIGDASGRCPTAGGLAAYAARSGARRFGMHVRTACRPDRSQFAISRVPADPAAARGRRPAPERQVLARWVPGRPRPRAIWLTNIDASRLHELIDLVALQARAAAGLNRMHDEVGLRHFEGRSFRGWHHHVTLASVAYAYQLTRSLERADDYRWRAYG